MKWGPQAVGEGRWRFPLWAPALSQATLEIEGREPVPMFLEDDGWLAAEAEAEPGTRYRFRISADLAVPDPASRAQADDVHGYSLVVDPESYHWREGGWTGRPWEETVIYELHPGLLGGFNGIADHLPRLAELGVTAIELMPIADFSGRRNWGYDGVLPYAPDAAYGSPDELKTMIDRAHELGLMVFLDVVYNHFGPEGNYLGAYAPEFFHPEINTPWGAAIAFDRPPVRRFFIDNALMWIHEYRFDGLRFDAVHAIQDRSFLDDLAAEIRGSLPAERQVHLVLENEENDARRLENGYDAQWNDDFHNVLHVILTGETSSYYSDFAGRPIEKLARCLEQGFIYQGEASPNQGHERGSPSGHLPPTAFVSFLQNHDQIGNRALGERLTLLTDKDRLRAATALLLLSPQIPLIFMGDEIGSRSPFLFFTDFHDELADAVREGRRKEFAKFAAFSDPEARKKIPDPNAPETFERSRPQEARDSAEWLDFYRELLELRAREIVPRLRGARALPAEPCGDGAVTARWRLGDGKTLIMVVNFSESEVVLRDLPSVDPLFSLKKSGAGASFAAWLR